MAWDLSTFHTESRKLLFYRDILQHPAGAAFVQFLDCWVCNQKLPLETEVLNAYGHWFHTLSHHATHWKIFVIRQILASDNPFTQRAQREPIHAFPAPWLDAARSDLRILQRWTAEGMALIHQTFSTTVPIPLNDLAEERDVLGDVFDCQDWGGVLPKLLAYYQQRGTGLWAEYNAFCWQAGALTGIPHPDPITFLDLAGYGDQQQTIRHNTEALLQGHRALNVLLYGSRGSGKSALVKALVADYSDRGLRLIEVHKSDMADLPQVIEPLRDSVLKFVIFIDDLSFEEEQEDYKALKVILEGSVFARPQNVVVYATSNRRHLVREYFGDRPRPSHADEVHAWDTVQEKLALSDRFGITLTFDPPSQDLYLHIVRHLADRAELTWPPETLEYEALQWATRRNGRSGRTARQFIDYCIALGTPGIFHNSPGNE
jgi:uncharacterized protein